MKNKSVSFLSDTLILLPTEIDLNSLSLLYKGWEHSFWFVLVSPALNACLGKVKKKYGLFFDVLFEVYLEGGLGRFFPPLSGK